MTRFTTFLAMVVGGMEIIQPAAASAAGVVAAGLSAKMYLRSVGFDSFQRRQVAPCDSLCNSIINTVVSNNCTPSACCSASFENGYFKCLVCVTAIIDLTDYTEPQSNIDLLYNECANLGLQLPVLTFPGINPNRTLSFVAPSSQTTAATITFAPPPPFFISATTTSPATTSAQTTSTQTSLPKSTSSSGIRSAETSCFNPTIASAIMLGLWLNFAVP